MKNKDYVELGGKKYKINFDIPWPILSELTAEVSEIEQRPDPSKILEYATRMDKWMQSVLTNGLIGFEMSALKDVKITRKEIQNLTTEIFWSLRSGSSFLGMGSSDSSTSKNQETSPHAT